MEDLLSKIFDKVAFYEKDGIQFGIEYDAQVEELLEPLRLLVMRKSSDLCWEYVSWQSLCQKLWNQQSSRCYHNNN